MCKTCTECGKSYSCLGMPGRDRLQCSPECARAHRLKKSKASRKQFPCTSCGQLYRVHGGGKRTTLCEACFLAKRKIDAIENNRRNCEWCGTEFFRRPRQDDAARCCSRKCGLALSAKNKAASAFRPDARASLRMGSLKPCEVCGQYFDSSGLSKYCCGQECRLERDRRRYAGGFAAWNDKRCIDCGSEVAVVGSYKGQRCKPCRKARKKASQKVAGYGGLLKAIGRTKDNLAMVAALLKDAGNVCPCCGLMMTSGGDPNHDRHCEIDHELPRSKGGTNDASNLRVMCRRCNHLKRDYVAVRLVLTPRHDDMSNSLIVTNPKGHRGSAYFGSTTA